MIVFKVKMALRGILATPGFVIVVQEKACMDEALVLCFIEKIWQPNIGPGSLLIWDTFHTCGLLQHDMNFMGS